MVSLSSCGKKFFLACDGCNAHLGLTGPEGYHETEPGEEEDSSIDADWVEERHRARLPVDRVILWRAPERRHVEAHSDGRWWVLQ